MRCSEPGHRALVAIHASREPGRIGYLGGEMYPQVSGLLDKQIVRVLGRFEEGDPALL